VKEPVGSQSFKFEGFVGRYTHPLRSALGTFFSYRFEWPMTVYGLHLFHNHF
jgi:hypothetical protein